MRIQRTHRLQRLPTGIVLGVAAFLVTAGAQAATIPVTTLFDTDLLDGQCSLREAIVAANTDLPYRDCPAGSGDDRIEVALTGVLSLAGPLPTIEESVDLRGPSSGILWIDGGGLHRPFLIDSPGDDQIVALRRIRIRNGFSPIGGAGIYVAAGDSLLLEDATLASNASTDKGGGLMASGAALVVVRRATITGNTSNSLGAGLFVESGDLVLEDSTVSGNVAGAAMIGAGGGGVSILDGAATIRRSTISGNRAEGGGGILVSSNATLSLELSTVTGNVADTIANPSDGAGGGVGTVLTAAATFFASIIAGNVEESTAGVTAPDISCLLSGSIASDGFNLVGVNDGCAIDFPASPAPGLPNLNGDFVGTSAAPIDPGLGPLAANGGTTRTHLPLAFSPAIDQGSCPGELHDQRGWNNPSTGLRRVDQPPVPNFGDGCDIGAVEVGASPPLDLPFADGFESGDTGAWSSVVP